MLKYLILNILGGMFFLFPQSKIFSLDTIEWQIVDNAPGNGKNGLAKGFYFAKLMELY